MVTEISSGPCVAMEIRAAVDAPRSFREFAGPADPVSSNQNQITC